MSDGRVGDLCGLELFMSVRLYLSRTAGAKKDLSKIEENRANSVLSQAQRTYAAVQKLCSVRGFRVQPPIKVSRSLVIYSGSGSFPCTVPYQELKSSVG